jgi:hypothetical protein
MEINENVAPLKRPVFLMVLCILTFVGSGIGLISGITGYFTAGNTEKQMEEIKSKLNEMDSIGMNKENKATQKIISLSQKFSKGITKEAQQKTSLSNIFSSILCLLGALLMWGYSKKGFYVYILGTIIGIAAPLVFYGVSNFMGMFTAFFVALIGIVFVILYGVNYKHLYKP